jgi:hypothetical protein
MSTIAEQVLGTTPAETSKVEASPEMVLAADRVVARQVNLLTLYLVSMLILSFWFLFDVWSSNFVLFRLVGVSGKQLEDPLLRTIGLTMAGGSFGGILYHIRMLFQKYTKGQFSARWIGKHLSAPWESAAMALVVLALIRGGVALFGGSTGTDVSGVNNFAAFGTGALVGLGMRDVVAWISEIVRTVFKAEPTDSNSKTGPASGSRPEDES